MRIETCEEYDPETGMWVSIAVQGDLTPRMGHSCTLLRNGKVLIVGGWDPEDRCELYDPSTRRAKAAARLPVKISGFVTIPIYD
jgi:hypothetical protein